MGQVAGQLRMAVRCFGKPRRRAAETVLAASEVAGRSRRYTSTRTLEADYALQPRILGSGMSGPVRLATSLHDGRQHAVKSFKKTGMSQRHREDLRSEAEIYLSLDHPHVARLEMVYETDEELHLVMELMEGGELYDRLAEKKSYTEEAAAEATRQMLLAVAYLHAHRIAHRDLKLENFLYERRDSDLLKIIDFGFAKFTERSTKMSQACGSIHYVAPEVLAHAYTERADMWSMGVIVYMLLTGSPPIHGTDDEVLKKIRAGQVHWSMRFQRLSPAAKRFLQSLLVLNPAKRLSAQDALKDPWITARHRAETAIDAGTLESVMTFSRASQFRRKVLSMMAWSLSTEDRSELQAEFLSIDRDRGGTISLKEFKEVMSRQFDVCSAEAATMFKCLDTDNSGEIEYTEFLAAALLGRVQCHEDVLRKAFVRFDVDGDGKIDRQELKGVLGDNFTQDDVADVLQAADTSGDGKIDYDEFFAYFNKTEEAEPKQQRTERRQRTEKLGRVIDLLIGGTEAPLASEVPAKAEPPPSGQPLPMLLSNLRAEAHQKA